MTILIDKKKVKGKNQTHITIIGEGLSYVTIKSIENFTLENLEKFCKEAPENFMDAFWTAFSCIGI